MSSLDVAPGFRDGIPPIPFDHASKRAISFCCSPRSGWRSYDLAGAEARAAGHFEVVAPWSLLWSDALAGRISVDDLDGFTWERRERLARRIAAIPAGKNLADFDKRERSTVHDLCSFGYPGVWAPKSTKVSSLYRPQAVPVLDGYVAMAFGFGRNDFSEGKEPRWARISRVVDALADYLDAHRNLVRELREAVGAEVADIEVASDLRLLDIVIWCSQDDRLERPGKKQNAWLDAPTRRYAADSMTPISVIPKSAEAPRRSDHQSNDEEPGSDG